MDVPTEPDSGPEPDIGVAVSAPIDHSSSIRRRIRMSDFTASCGSDDDRRLMCGANDDR